MAVAVHCGFPRVVGKFELPKIYCAKGEHCQRLSIRRKSPHLNSISGLARSSDFSFRKGSHVTFVPGFRWRCNRQFRRPCVKTAVFRRRSAASERSDAANDELLMFLFQLDLATRLQRALNGEQYEAAQQLREKIAEVEQEVAQQRQEKMGSSVSSKDEAQDTAISILRLKAELQKAIEGEDYPGAAQLRDEISKAEATSLAASARALILENLTYTYRLGQRVQHKAYGYLGVVCGMDPTCCETKEWIERAGVNKLARGKVQPFYQILVDVHEQPSLLVAYVPEDNLKEAEGDANTERFDHPYTYFLFFGMDSKGDFIPSKQLREKYNAARHELPWDEDSDSPDSSGNE